MGPVSIAKGTRRRVESLMPLVAKLNEATEEAGRALIEFEEIFERLGVEVEAIEHLAWYIEDRDPPSTRSSCSSERRRPGHHPELT